MEPSFFHETQAAAMDEHRAGAPQPGSWRGGAALLRDEASSFASSSAMRRSFASSSAFAVGVKATSLGARIGVTARGA
jgi:hypothetical protein